MELIRNIVRALVPNPDGLTQRTEPQFEAIGLFRVLLLTTALLPIFFAFLILHTMTYQDPNTI